MADEHDLPSNSDESDDDYMPEGVDEALSEEDSEDISENEGEDNDENNSNKGRKRRKNKTGKNTKRKKKEESADESDTETSTEKKKLSEEEEKQRADMLWADFMKDTDTIPKQKESNETNSSHSSNENSKSEETVKIKKIFEFAGEEVTVEKEVPVTMLTKSDNTKRSPLTSENLSSSRGRGGSRRGAGISSVLGQLGKKAKISTLEKSKLDWENFKKQENLEEEISSHNKGKDGYLDKQDFLQRADLRQFEIEKQLRSNSRRSTR